MFSCFDLEAELAKQRAKEAKSAAKQKQHEKKDGESKKRKKGVKEDEQAGETKDRESKKSRKKDVAEKTEQAEAEAAESPGQRRKVLADKAFAKLKAAGIAEFEASELGPTKKSFSIAPANKQGSTIGVVLYSESFYVYDAVSPEHWESECGSYKVMSSFVPFVLLPSLVHTVNLQATI